jgi:hypothetical protein
MTRLEELTPGSRIQGLIADGAVTILQAQWHASSAVTLTYRDDGGRVGQEIVYRDDEAQLGKQEAGRPWSFDADGRLFRLASEARRIQLAWLFDPFLAVQTSMLEPLPHQIDAVYERMLGRQPLRFLLADDPGAGRTIMAGLYIKELMIRGDVERCLIVAPGRTEGSAALVDVALSAGVGRVVQESVCMLYPDRGSDWIDENVPVDTYPIARANLAAEADEPLTKGEYAAALASAARKATWLRGPGRAALLFGDRVTSLTRSLRVSNRRFRSETGWTPRYANAQEGWMAW